jgi:hypothetical protein
VGVNVGKHYWFSSRILGGYKVVCDESWFFGTEISSNPFFCKICGQTWTTLDVTGGEAHVYGGVIRLVVDEDSNTSKPTTGIAVKATGPGEVHIHGTGIDVISPLDTNVIALQAVNGGTIHANGTAYNMSTGTGGTITRILNQGGSISAPYVWKQDSIPPDIASENGADMIVDTSGSQPHLLIYSDNCSGTGGPWFDVVTHACR